MHDKESDCIHGVMHHMDMKILMLLYLIFGNGWKITIYLLQIWRWFEMHDFHGKSVNIHYDADVGKTENVL